MVWGIYLTWMTFLNDFDILRVLLFITLTAARTMEPSQCAFLVQL
jgi:hypothetical protein